MAAEKQTAQSSGSQDACWEVTDIVLCPERLTHLVSCEIEEPQAGWRGNDHSMDISGGVVGKSIAATTLQVVHEGRTIRTVPLSGEQPEIAERYSNAPGVEDSLFYAPVSLIGLGVECKLALRAVLADGRPVPLGSIRLRRQPVRSGFEPKLRPLLVTCLGRSGSTWVMRLVGAHPEVVVYDHFPYEFRLAAYWLHMVRVLSEPADRDKSSDQSFQADPNRIGHNPFNDAVLWRHPALRQWLNRGYVEGLAAFCQANIEEWYRRLVADRNSEEAEALPTYFAEKMTPTPTLTQDVAWELYPKAKEIVLVRDFRDMVCSILAFDEKRGWHGFGREDGITDVQYLHTLKHFARALCVAWQCRKDRAHLVRYEDLAVRPRETVAGLLDYLELEASPSVVDQLLAEAMYRDSYELEEHRTSDDVLSSIGRWRRDLDESMQKGCQQVFGDILEEFGYPDAGYGAERVTPGI